MDHDGPDRHVQLRIGFAPPSAPAVIELTLSGLVVLADAPSGRWDEMLQHLTAVAVSVAPHPGGGYCFPVAQLPRLAELPDVVTVRVGPLLGPLWALVAHPPADNLPATLELDRCTLRLRWFDGTFRWDEPVDPSCAPALLASDLPFVATADAWDLLRKHSHLPVQAGRCRVNHDGFIEIDTAKPQLVEASPLPALFRIDATHFGLPLAYADRLDDADGFSWVGPKPVLERGPSQLPELPFRLSAHARSDLGAIVEQLASYGAVALSWRSGLGRRVAALAAIETLDAWPALIVTPPWAVWLWQRHLDMLKRRGSLTGGDCDARIVTYLDLALGVRFDDPAAVIFDELTSAEATGPEARDACRRLDGVLGAYRIALGSTWPDDPAESVALLSVVRPGEFRDDVPVVLRYPVRPLQRAREHVALYVRRRDHDPAAEPAPFRRDTVRLVDIAAAQRDELTRLAQSFTAGRVSPLTALLAACEITSVGTETSLSPKFAAAMQVARDGTHAGMRVAVCTRSQRAASMLVQLLRPVRAAVIDETEGQIAIDLADDTLGVVVVRYDNVLPDLRSFDWVVVCEYPPSTAALDAAVGSPLDANGPALTVVLHAAGTVDDRLAMFAAAARDGIELPRLSEQDVSYILGRRWVDTPEPAGDIW